MELFIERHKQILDIYERYKDKIPALHEDIVSTCSKMLMSKDKQVSSYGIFLPHEDMKYAVGEYKGGLTKNEKNANFKYYFDENDRVILTERYGIDYIFYFYKTDCVEMVWYSLKRQRIDMISLLRYCDKKVSSFMQTQTLQLPVADRKFGFYDYTYNYVGDEVEILFQIIGLLPNGQLKKLSKLYRQRT